LLLATAVILLEWKRLSASWKLIVASIASLHAFHIPYWFPGILGWHYVFETAPLLLLLFAEATRRLFTVWRSWRAQRLEWWWGGVITTAALINMISVEPVWRSRLQAAQSEAAFARFRYDAFRNQAEKLAVVKPILVLVEPDPSDRHMDYVWNRPDLSGPVLVARVHGPAEMEKAAGLYPDRHPYLFQAATGTWSDFRPAAK
jgi:hypothetical protein